jgi:hypothetical protein
MTIASDIIFVFLGDRILFSAPFFSVLSFLSTLLGFGMSFSGDRRSGSSPQSPDEQSQQLKQAEQKRLIVQFPMRYAGDLPMLDRKLRTKLWQTSNCQAEDGKCFKPGLRFLPP